MLFGKLITAVGASVQVLFQHAKPFGVYSTIYKTQPILYYIHVCQVLYPKKKENISFTHVEV